MLIGLIQIYIVSCSQIWILDHGGNAVQMITYVAFDEVVSYIHLQQKVFNIWFSKLNLQVESPFFSEFLSFWFSTTIIGIIWFILESSLWNVSSCFSMKRLLQHVSYSLKSSDTSKQNINKIESQNL